MTDLTEVLALALFDIGAVQFGEFRLKVNDKMPGAPLSPIYIDLRRLRSFPDIMDSAVWVYRHLVSSLKFDLFADASPAATPFVALLSHQMRVPMISPHRRGKDLSKGAIDGVFKKGQAVLLIDDMSLAETKLEAISVLEQNGLKVHDIAILVDREQGSVTQLQEQGYCCHVAMKLTGLLKLYLDYEKITKGEYERTMAYLERVRTH